LGYSRFSDLLNDPHLNDVCRVEVQGSACLVVSKRQSYRATGYSPVEASLPWASSAAEEESAAAAMAAAYEMGAWPSSAWPQAWHPSARAAAAFYNEAPLEHVGGPPPGLGLMGPPGFNDPSMLCLPRAPPGLESWETSNQAWDSEVPASEPMKVTSSPGSLLVDMGRGASCFDKSPEAVAFLERSAGSKIFSIAIKETKTAKLPRHRRSSSVSTNVDSENEDPADSDSSGQEHAGVRGNAARPAEPPMAPPPGLA